MELLPREVNIIIITSPHMVQWFFQSWMNISGSPIPTRCTDTQISFYSLLRMYVCWHLYEKDPLLSAISVSSRQWQHSTSRHQIGVKTCLTQPITIQLYYPRLVQIKALKVSENICNQNKECLILTSSFPLRSIRALAFIPQHPHPPSPHLPFSAASCKHSCPSPLQLPLLV